ncbi:molybdenum cofactor guanylyltransferase MobA [Halomonas sp. Bachu 37]|uniref:molybdenum cofactor guanylyltransferase MobA n=1 Tax=Halomonas kashgarensis TaxID=3084920 RepID=UPI00321747B7
MSRISCAPGRHEITGVILAGGRGRRMGGVDKGLESLAGVALVDHVMARLQGQVNDIIISANRHCTEYSRRGVTVVSDEQKGYQGPLMGIQAGLKTSPTRWVLLVPCDTPVLPLDLVARLAAGIGKADIAVAHDGERNHPVVALLHRGLVDSLKQALARGERKVTTWFATHKVMEVDFSDCPDAFINLNSLDQCQALEARLNETHYRERG